MNHEPVEEVLRRYGPATPPDGLRVRVLAAGEARERSRRWSRGLALAAAIALLGAGLLILQANREYNDAMRMCGGPSCISQPAKGQTSLAGVLSVQIPGAMALLQKDGDSHD